MTKWYYRDYLDRKIGPLTAGEFGDCVTEGEIRPETQVWRSGLGGWMTYRSLLGSGAMCACVTRGAAATASPQSSSYRTQIALGASPVNCRPRKAKRSTSKAAAHLARLSVETSASRRRWTRLTDLDPQTAMEAQWLGQQFVRVALVAAVLILIQFAVTEALAPAKKAIAGPATVEKVEASVQVPAFRAASIAGLPADWGTIAPQR